MKIQKLQIESFKSFYEPYEIDFNDIKGLWKVSGQVGAGKTTIGEAILFGLFGTISGKNNGDLVPWGAKKAKVNIWCNSNGHDIYISREISHSGTSKLYVTVDNEELVFTNKRDAQQQLETEYFDVSKVTMELLCIISFNNFKSIATLNTADTKKFLDQVLGFHILSQYSIACKELQQEKMKGINDVKQYIIKLDAQINKLTELSNISIIEGNMNQLQDSFKLIKETIQDIKKERDNKINKIQEKLTVQQSKLSEIKTLGASVKKEIDFIKQGICPTCGAQIDQSKLQEKEAIRSNLLESYNNIAATIKELEECIKQHKTIYNAKESELTNSLLEINNKITKLKEQESRLKISNDQIEELKKEKELALKDYDNYILENTKWDKLYSILTTEARTKILDSFIPVLNKNIMEYSKQLHQPYVVKFDNQFKCSVSLCGFMDDIPISSLSTGQLKTVDMIIILGILGTIIGNASTNVIFLDELFSNLDGQLRNDMCSVLKQFIKPSDTMFIISHQELDEQYLDGEIKIKQEKYNQFEMHSKLDINKK